MTDDPMQNILAALGRLETGQESLRTGQEGLIADLASLRTGQEGFIGDLESLRTGQGGLIADLASLRTEMEHLHAGQDRLRADLMERMDRLQHEIGLVRDDVTVNFGSSDHALRIAKGASDEVRGLGEMLTTMRRQIMRLQTDVEQLRGGGAAA